MFGEAARGSNSFKGAMAYANKTTGRQNRIASKKFAARQTASRHGKIVYG
jgi:hypothetical protein